MPDLEPLLRRFNWADLAPAERNALDEWVRSLGYDPRHIAVKFAVTRDSSARWAVHLTRQIAEDDGRFRMDVAAEHVVSRPVVVETGLAKWPAFLTAPE